MIQHEHRGCAAVALAKGSTHRLYEDRFRILSMEAPLVRDAGRGEIFAVFDGIGSAIKGREAAQLMCDRLTNFYRHPDRYTPTSQGLLRLLMEANREINGWGADETGFRTLGGCAGTVAWAIEDDLWLFHAGDTMAMLDTGERILEATSDHQRADGAITRFFGLGEALEIDVTKHRLLDYERILLMSDGVTKVLDRNHAAQMVRDFDDIEHAARHVVQQSLIRRTWDDVTVLVVDINEMGE
jgi:serine/threonine protein phosphatase PrpC